MRGRRRAKGERTGEGEEKTGLGEERTGPGEERPGKGRRNGTARRGQTEQDSQERKGRMG